MASEPLREVDNHANGEGEIAGYTVLHDKAGMARAIAVVDLDTGARTAAASLDPQVMQDLEISEGVGKRVRVIGASFEPV